MKLRVVGCIKLLWVSTINLSIFTINNVFQRWRRCITTGLMFSSRTNPIFEVRFKIRKLTWIFFTAPLVEILNGTSTIALRSIASKLVSHQELGDSFFNFLIFLFCRNYFNKICCMVCKNLWQKGSIIKMAITL